MRRIRDPVAVVTGAGSGIGRALAVDLAARGASLALADVNAAGLDETRGLLGAADARSYTVDVSNAGAVEQFAGRVRQDFGRASLLINNAGVALFGTFAEISLADMDWLMRINFWGVVHGCKFFLPLLENEPEAHIVNISSVLGLIGTPGQVSYCSSKFAVRGFSEALREELRTTSVRVTCVHPAGVNTRIAENARPGVATQALEQAEALKRYGKLLAIPPADAAQTIVKGILRNQDRVLIGKDAYRIDFIQRLFPARASAMASASTLKKLESKDAGSSGDTPGLRAVQK
jgi:NAD(P)-dependent dehydrogenase (short-subunit alcohol dehydrogenase family)